MNKSMDLDKQFHTIDHQTRLDNSKKLHLRSSSYVGSDRNDETIIVQVNSNMNESSKKLFQSISGSNNNPTALEQHSLMFGVGRSELTNSRNFENIKGENIRELKDTVSGLPSLMTRVSTNVNDIKKPVSSSIDIGSANYGPLDRNAVSSRIVGLNQLNKNLKNQKKHRYENR